MKKSKYTAVIFSVLLVLPLFASCGGETKTLHCDSCGAEVTVADSNMDEDWLIFCKKCSEEMGPMVSDRTGE